MEVTVDEIVISGFSGKFPECENVDEFEKKLYDGVDMVTEDARRWPVGLYGLPGRNGKLKDLSRFDAAFFRVSPKQADAMDPGLRILFENTYEAIVDAGYNPEELRGKKIGVYVGQTANEALDLLGRDPETASGYGMSGANRAMTANRISYTFDFRGSSFAVDTACSSSMVAFHLGVSAIQRGEVEGAIVAGVNILLSPHTSLLYNRLNMLSSDGSCRAFDSSGKGYVRSETVGAFFIQKAGNARRMYASVLGTGANVDGYKELGITYPIGERQRVLISEVLARSNVAPHDVAYVEAHGTGTKAGDPQEVNSLHQLFCSSELRTSPLLLGSVKSNIGHAEAAAAVGQLTKVLLSMERGIIPGNLHFKLPNPEIIGLTDGTIKVVESNRSWPAGIATINSFGMGGANANVVLKSNSKIKKLKGSSVKSYVPELITCSGRSESGVEHILEQVNQHFDDLEFLSLIREVYKINSHGHTHRGFLLEGDQNVSVVETPPNREVWFMFSGMGSQWVGMGRQLMALEPFARGMDKCAKALESVGVDLSAIIGRGDDICDDVTYSFLCIASIQVAMVDLLSEVGVIPDGLVGHSAGELGCAYADGGFTAEETVLAAHSRGLAIESCNVKGGAMAAVAGLSWEEVKAKLPTGVYAACHNSKDSVTISGREENVINFVKQLETEGVTVRPVNSSGIAFHSPFVSPASPILVDAIKKINPVPKPRTARWISSCVPDRLLDEPWARMNSAEYHAYNVTSPVLFKEAIDRIPKNAIVLEIAPHGLLGGLVKKSKPGVDVLALAKKDVLDGLRYLLRTLGKLYNAGVAVDLRALYPRVEYPVARGTPRLSNLIRWDHSAEWHVPLESNISGSSGFFEQIIDLNKEEQSYLTGHTIDGRILFPATGYLTLAWRAYARRVGRNYDELSVIISDVHIHRATVLSTEGSTKFSVNIAEGTGRFEIMEGDAPVVTGRIVKADDSIISAFGSNEQQAVPSQGNSDHGRIAAEDVYTELKLRHYEYAGAFRGINYSNIDGKSGCLAWVDNWITFMDTMLQFDIIGNDTRELYLPVRIDKVIIDPIKHKQYISSNKEILVHSCKKLSIIRSGGVEIRNLKVNHARKRPISQSPPKLERQIFVPYVNTMVLPLYDGVACALQIVQENSDSSIKMKCVEIASNPSQLLSPMVATILAEEPNVVADIVVIASNPEEYSDLRDDRIKLINQSIESCLDTTVNVVIAPSIIDNQQLQRKLIPHLKPGAFLLSKEEKSHNFILSNDVHGLELIAMFAQKDKTLVLYRQITSDVDVMRMKLDEQSFSWIHEVKEWLKKYGNSGKKLLLISQNMSSGILGFLRCLRLEEGGKAVRVVYTAYGETPSTESQLEQQLKKGLTMNVWRGGQWGSFRYHKIDGLENRNDFPTKPTTDAYVNTLVRGDLSSLQWIQSPLSITPRQETDNDKERCTVYYAPLNFRDIMLATGKLPPDALPGNLAGQDCVLGLEFSGRDSTGKRVIGIVEACGLATSVLADKGFLWAVPDTWSLEQASTVPIVFATAYYSLIVRGHLRRGESVLIHAGSGGVGLAAISIALDMGCRVFTTVGTPAKKQFLLRTFPQLNESMIGNSRDTSFEWMVLDGTSGRGVDVVLNSLAGEQLQASVRCLAEGGRFLEIGKVDLSNNASLGMALFLKNTTFHGILLDALFQVGLDNPEKAEVNRLMKEGIRSGVVRPLPITVFLNNQLEEAFRFMATGKHIGKVVLKIRQEEPEKTVMAKEEMVRAVSKNYLNPGKSYIIVGGLGGFGLELAEWMVTRGATNLILTSRSGVTNGYQELCLRRWKNKSVRVVVSTINCCSEKGAKELIVLANNLAPVGGIYNLAGVLRDGLFNALTEESFLAVSSAKVHGTRLLDLTSRSACPHLDHFVVFSSVSCGRGNAGQTNYGYANNAMETICEARLKSGFPALAVQWGAVGDVGMIMKNLKGDDETRIAGTLPQKISSCLNTLDIFLGLGNGKNQLDHVIVSSIVLANKDTPSQTSSTTVSSIVANIVGIKDLKRVGDATLAELGMDSLMGTEIKQALEINLDLLMSPQEIRNLTFVKLAEMEQKTK